MRYHTDYRPTVHMSIYAFYVFRWTRKCGNEKRHVATLSFAVVAVIFDFRVTNQPEKIVQILSLHGCNQSPDFLNRWLTFHIPCYLVSFTCPIALDLLTLTRLVWPIQSVLPKHWYISAISRRQQFRRKIQTILQVTFNSDGAFQV